MRFRLHIKNETQCLTSWTHCLGPHYSRCRLDLWGPRLRCSNGSGAPASQVGSKCFNKCFCLMCIMPAASMTQVASHNMTLYHFHAFWTPLPISSYFFQDYMGLVQKLWVLLSCVPLCVNPQQAEYINNYAISRSTLPYLKIQWNSPTGPRTPDVRFEGIAGAGPAGGLCRARIACALQAALPALVAALSACMACWPATSQALEASRQWL